MAELFHDCDFLLDFEFCSIELVDNSRFRWTMGSESNTVGFETGVLVDDGITSDRLHCLE